MLRKICSLAVLSLVAFSSFLAAEIEYEIHDIGTLQSSSSIAVDLNNSGQILGWYNIDGTNNGKYFFLRDDRGCFHTIPSIYASSYVNWKFLTDDGKVYGTNDDNTNSSVLFMWDKYNGVVKLGNLPGPDVMGVNNKGEVLIKSVVEIRDGKSVSVPAIWQNGVLKKLSRLKGNLGIESEQSYGLSINNNGDVVGESLAIIVYKNNEYKTLTHATLWKNGKVEDLHYLLPKTEQSRAISINDRGDILINAGVSTHDQKYILKASGGSIQVGVWPQKINNNCLYNGDSIFKDSSTIESIWGLTRRVQYDAESLWATVTKIVKVNDKGEIIAQGKTIYGEDHAMILTPAKPK